MHRRQWEAKTKAMIVLEGLKGKPVAELCTEPQLSQAQDDQGRDQFLAHAATALEVHEQSQRAARLTPEKARLKTLVGDLTLELNKSDEVCGCAGPHRPWGPSGTRSSSSGSGSSRPSTRSGAIAVSGLTGLALRSKRSPTSGCGDGCGSTTSGSPRT